ncbi:MAG: PQQ-dependent sugar dehydrogenase, partial [Anaerolineales bacterium]|nr:PQQ-dependent sugar dehydrogenase [Anaerolineales bacterium]
PTAVTAAATEPPAPAEPTTPPTDVPATEIPAAPEPTATAVAAQPVDGVQLQFVASGFFKPLGLTHAGDARLFVAEQHGLISIIQEGQRLSTPFLDIIERVNSNANEQGLLGLAFHPNYAENGYFYVNYSGANGETTISRFQVSADANAADAGSETVLLTIAQPYSNHNGGQIAFGPDGYLYIGMGDGGSQNDPQNNGQNPDALLGKILRIDVDGGEPYAIPADNPYAADDRYRPEVWAMGLRNPWRFSFDRATGDLYIADVGQNAWEEIDFQPAGTGGLNYGWRQFEASNCYLDDCTLPAHTPPVFEYNHSGGHCSVTGGYVYRGQAYPELSGNYFLADYCSGTMWRLFHNGDGSWDNDQIGQTGFLVSSFGEDVNGELYVLNQAAGEVYQIVP